MSPNLSGNVSKGLLFILSAPAGTGKTTLVQLLTRDSPNVVASVSYTTRKPRPGEIEGIHYNFIDKDEFNHRIQAGDFLEHVELYDNFYGTSKAWVESKLCQGKHVILVIDTQGAELVKQKTQVISIFVAPPSLDELEKRLRLRRTESDEMIEKRLKWSKREIEVQKKYNYLIINDDLSSAYQALRSILIAEEHRVR